MGSMTNLLVLAISFGLPFVMTRPTAPVGPISSDAGVVVVHARLWQFEDFGHPSDIWVGAPIRLLTRDSVYVNGVTDSLGVASFFVQPGKYFVEAVAVGSWFRSYNGYLGDVGDAGKISFCRGDSVVVQGGDTLQAKVTLTVGHPPRPPYR